MKWLLVLIYFFERFLVIIYFYAVLFFMYLLWGVLKMQEHACWAEERRRYAWRAVALLLSLVVVVLWHLGLRWSWPYPGWHLPFLAVLLFCVIWYRKW